MKTTKGIAMAFGMPLDTAIERMKQSAAELQRSGEKVAKERNESSFGERIKAAVHRRVRPRHAANSSSEEQHETFAEKVKRKVKQQAAGRRVTMRQ